jgi:hypothetical protein
LKEIREGEGMQIGQKRYSKRPFRKLKKDVTETRNNLKTSKNKRPEESRELDPNFKKKYPNQCCKSQIAKNIHFTSTLLHIA